MLNSIINGIYELLLEQKEIQAALCVLAREKREAAIKNDTGKLTDIVSAEYTELSRIKKLEKQRTALLSGAEDTMGKPPRDITVSDLIGLAGPDDARRLSGLRSELIALIDELKRQNDENRLLVRTQLEYTDMMLNALSNTGDPLNNFYGTDGQSLEVDVSRGVNLLDTEI